ncbi:DUF4159 domain-containing protein [Bartonella sp. HY038]|uniref:DUF4159 domain-containing protein n=1 Tax=Bartonella sp. HY038 TaxID=2759660 RepID=UPI0015FC1AAB|nr:DUF4159 domain-containing protein [Bartonella sp. HY038]
MIPLSFGTPLILISLVVLPAIWWLLRMTPPRPQREVFPPLRILASLIKKDQTPTKSPWWLVLLRLAIAALIIIALAQPSWREDKELVQNKGALALLIDNSWPSATNWQNHKLTARKLIEEANNHNLPIYILASNEPQNSETGPFTGSAALSRLDAIKPMPLAADRTKLVERLKNIGQNNPNLQTDLQIAYLTDSLSEKSDKASFDQIQQIPHSIFQIFSNDKANWIGLTSVNNQSDKMIINAIRSDEGKMENIPLSAFDSDGRKIGEAQLHFDNSAIKGQAEITTPLEIRNDIAWLRLDDKAYASATLAVDASNKRRRIAMLAPLTSELPQPLLSPLYYPAKALAPYGDMIYSTKGDIDENIKTLLASKPAMLVIGDIANIPPQSEEAIARFIHDGGTLLRFAGPNLAAAESNDGLLPVKLRRGERNLGGVMSWAKPQSIAPFAADSPFATLTPPQDIEIARQILPEPSVDLHDKSWVNLADGTPLVTAQTRGAGRIIFVHTSAGPEWSNLPLSGFFVDLLRQFVALSHQPVSVNDGESSTKTLAPWRIFNAEGFPQAPSPSDKPISLNGKTPITASLDHLPGLYGQQDALYALNLLNSDSDFKRVELPKGEKIAHNSYDENDTISLIGIMWGLAFLLFILDSIIMLILGGLNFKNLKRNNLSPLILLIVFFCGFALSVTAPNLAQAQATNADDSTTQSEADLVMRASKTHLAYVKTGDDTIDATSKAGLEALNQFIVQRTTIEPGQVIELDLDKDELAFYPLIYWPIDASTNMPSQKAIGKIDAFMHQGGTVLFDTRDEITSNLNLDGSPTANTNRLREILAGLNVPPLEPQPQNHVIGRSYYIMPDFPGRYRGSQLWLEATQNNGENRPVNAGDGVSPILITANDFAGAWAHNGKGDWQYRLVPDDNMQRVWAFRGGLNIVMYVLSGNYKSDQVHVPEILKRLGQ